MIGIIGSILGDTLLGILALLMVATMGVLMKDSVHSMRLRRRQRRERERTRREFWGYE